MTRLQVRYAFSIAMPTALRMPMRTTAIEDPHADCRNPGPASRVRALKTRMDELNHHPTFNAIMKLTLCSSLCGLALLFTSGCSDTTPPPTVAVPPARQPEAAVERQKSIPEEDMAFFEKKYQKKLTGVKPKNEYSDPDQFYSAIGEQLGIPEIAWRAAAEKFGWKRDDGKQTFTMLKGGPTPGGGQGTWDVMFMRYTVNPQTQKPDPASMQQVMVQIHYDGNIEFPEVPKENQ